MKHVKINSGLRGVRYFIEFPVVTTKFDALGLNESTKSVIQNGKSKFGSRITGKDYYHNEENLAYLIDYKVQSSQVGGTHTTGSVYIRGVRGEDGVDSFKFILEKSNDFSELDAQIVINAYE